MTDPGTAVSQVLAVLDDAAAGSAALELSSALARTLRRGLSVVYVESASSLGAAALPFTQVLSHSGSAWVPLLEADVERGFRAHAARLRQIAERVALRDALSWSLRVVRGSLPGAAIDLYPESDLLLLAARPSPWPPGEGLAGPRIRRPVVAVVTEGSEAGQRALAIATRLAQALAAVLETRRVDLAADPVEPAATFATLARSDVLVLPRALVDAVALAKLRCPVLLVG
jgi:hypothetical protein